MTHATAQKKRHDVHQVIVVTVPRQRGTGVRHVKSKKDWGRGSVSKRHVRSPDIRTDRVPIGLGFCELSMSTRLSRMVRAISDGL